MTHNSGILHKDKTITPRTTPRTTARHRNKATLNHGYSGLWMPGLLSTVKWILESHMSEKGWPFSVRVPTDTHFSSERLTLLHPRASDKWCLADYWDVFEASSFMSLFKILDFILMVLNSSATTSPLVSYTMWFLLDQNLTFSKLSALAFIPDSHYKSV